MWEDVQSLLTPIAAQSRYVGARPGAANVIDAAMAGAFFNVALGAFHEAAAYVRSEDVAIAEMRHSLHLWTDKLLELLHEALKAFESGEYETDQANLERIRSRSRSLATIDAASRPTRRSDDGESRQLATCMRSRARGQGHLRPNRNTLRQPSIRNLRRHQ